MPRVIGDWEVDERGEYFCYFDPYHAQCETEGELTAAQANIKMLTPYLLDFHFRKVILFKYNEAQVRWGE